MSQPTDPRHFEIKHAAAKALKDEGFDACASVDERKGKNSKSNIFGRQIKYMRISHENKKAIAILTKALAPFNCVVGVVESAEHSRYYNGPYLQVQRGKDFKV